MDFEKNEQLFLSNISSFPISLLIKLNTVIKIALWHHKSDVDVKSGPLCRKLAGVCCVSANFLHHV